MKKLIALLVVLLAVSVVVMGCGSKKIETDQGSVKLNDNGVQVENKDGSNAQVNVAGEGKEVSLPEDYPKDIAPIMDNGKVATALKNEDANKKISYMVSYTIDKEPKDVYNYYLDVLKDASESQKLEMNGTYSVSGVKRGKQVAVIIAAEEKEGQKSTNVSITIQPKQ